MSELNRFKQLRTRLAGQRTLTLPIPGYEGPGGLQVGVRYAVPSDDDLKWITSTASKHAAGKKVKGFEEDVLIKACETLVYCDDDRPEWTPLDPDVPVTFSSQEWLLEQFDIAAETARQAVKELFCPGGVQPFSIDRQAGEVVSWLTGEKISLDSELVKN